MREALCDPRSPDVREAARLVDERVMRPVRKAQAISRMLLGAKVLIGADATEAAMKQVRGPRILHVATHGFFLSDQAQNLAGARGIGLSLNNQVPMPKA